MVTVWYLSAHMLNKVALRIAHDQRCASKLVLWSSTLR